MRHELRKIANHLKNLSIWPISVVYADREFVLYRIILEDIFRTNNIFVEKSDKLCLADVVAYLNFKEPRLLRKIKNLKEIK